MSSGSVAHDPSAPFGGTSPRCAQGGSANAGGRPVPVNVRLRGNRET